VRNYHILASAFAVGVVVEAIARGSLLPIIYFLVFALSGVIGETVFSFWWHHFFAKRFWVYQVDALFHSYTSLLNFIPWGAGGLLYLSIVGYLRVSPPRTFYMIFSILVFLSVLVQIFIFNLYYRRNRKDFKFHEVNYLNFGLFYLTLFIPVLVTSFIYGPWVLGITLAFGVVAGVVEYLFGKSTEFFISKKLWLYQYSSFDKGHFTPLSIPAFALAGFYFWIISSFLNLLIKIV
jgi:hypothetical protein